MKYKLSEKSGIPVIYVDDNVVFNLGSDDPIEYIAVAAKIKNTNIGVTETVRDLVKISKINLKNDIKRVVNKKKLRKLSSIIHKYLNEKKKLPRENLEQMLQEIEKI